jgi:hypothetical protein
MIAVFQPSIPPRVAHSLRSPLSPNPSGSPLPPSHAPNAPTLFPLLFSPSHPLLPRLSRLKVNPKNAADVAGKIKTAGAGRQNDRKSDVKRSIAATGNAAAVISSEARGDLTPEEAAAAAEAAEAAEAEAGALSVDIDASAPDTIYVIVGYPQNVKAVEQLLDKGR